MSQSTVQTDLTVKDGLTSALKRAEASLRTWAARAGSAIASVSRKFSAFASGVGQAMRTASKYLLGFGTAILGIGAYAIKLASDIEESESKFDAVFKGGAAGAREWSDQLAKDVGRSTYDLRKFMAQLQDTFVPLGFARDQSAKLSQVLTELAVDLASFNNASEGETVDLLTSAMIGNHEAVRRFGIIITEATLKAKLMEMGIKGGTQAATEQQKALARLQIILASTSDAQGDAERTAGSFANQVKAMMARVKDFGKVLGETLMPIGRAVINLLSAMAETMERALSGGIPEFSGAIEKIAGFIDGIATGVRSIDFSRWKEQLGTLFGDVSNVLLETFKAVASMLTQTAIIMGQQIGEGIISALPGGDKNGLIQRGRRAVAVAAARIASGDIDPRRGVSREIRAEVDAAFSSGDPMRQLSAVFRQADFSGVGRAIDQLNSNVAAMTPSGPVQYELPARKETPNEIVNGLMGSRETFAQKLAASMTRGLALNAMQSQTQMGMQALNAWVQGKAAALPLQLAAASASTSKGHTAQWEDLTSHAKRIQAAAASKSPELDVQKRIEKQLEVQTRVEQAAAKTGELIAKGMDAASAGIAELVKRGFRAVAG